MARLNEPANTTTTTSAESLESLKRRFIRQNRELARSNSTQSIKIRNLETQISQLVANNVSLRATIVQLQSELDGSSTRSLVENVDNVKRRLEEKLNEIGGLVAELKRPRSKPSGPVGSPPRSAAQKLWKATSGIGDGLEGRQGWMPTIAEGKYFPRRTLEPSDVSELIVNGSSDSPEIGPPPQTSVDADSFLASQLESTTDQSTSTDQDQSLSTLLSANFETRRRRRVSNGGLDPTTNNPSDTFPSKENSAQRQSDLWTAQPIRAGAKRKLDMANRPSENDSAAPKNIRALAPPNTDSAKEAQGQKSPTRRVLAPKSVNTDPALSPKKVPANGKPEVKPTERNSAKENRQRVHVHRISKSKDADSNQDSEIVKTVELPPPECIKLEPKTPAPLDLFSPMSTEPSEPRPEGRGDTPPPANLTSRGGIRGDSAAAGRGSRRARASVNYAEPNLISKMRRPTKDLVDAVWNDPARASSASVEHPVMKREAPAADALSNGIVEEKGDKVSAGKGPAPVEDSRPEPQSPLGQKDDTSNAPPSFERSTARDRRRSALHSANSTSAQGDEQTGPSAAIAAVAAGSRKSSAAEQDQAVSSLGDAVQKLDIFDVAPSPPRLFGQLNPKDKTDPTRPSSATSMRSNGSASDRKTRQPAGALSSSALNRPRSRRQTLGTDKGAPQGPSLASSASTGGSKEKPVKSSKSIAVLGENAPSEGKTTAERIAERTAARRRSMML